MVAVRSPLIDLDMDEMTAKYVGVLEAQVAVLTVNEMKFRALLEALTGDTWDNLTTDFAQGELDKLAEQSLMRKLNISNMEAKKMIRLHKAKANGEDLRTEPPQA